MPLWRRWTEYERRWEADPRGVLVRRLVQGAPAKRNETIATWTRNDRLPQPDASDLTELSALGDRLHVLRQTPYPLPDVYAAACYLKDFAYGELDNTQR